MKVICDTNIWYHIGNEKVAYDTLPDGIELVGTILSIRELSSSPNLLSRLHEVRNAIRSMIINSNVVYYLHPFEYLKILDDPNYKNKSSELFANTLKITELIANGMEFSSNEKIEIEEFLKAEKEYSELFSEKFNNAVLNEIKPKVIDKRLHRRKILFDEKMTQNTINSFVSHMTEAGGLSNVFDWNIIDFFIKVFKEFFMQIDISHRKIKPNDWVDVFNLIYVQPGDKYWTSERRWINLIKDAGMEKYLFTY